MRNKHNKQLKSIIPCDAGSPIVTVKSFRSVVVIVVVIVVLNDDGDDGVVALIAAVTFRQIALRNHKCDLIDDFNNR